MALLQVKSSTTEPEGLALFSLGFRPFFLVAAIFSVVSIFKWLLIYKFQLLVPSGAITISQWHSHEMIYGYSMAVIAGFLLTAIMNWTGIQTIQNSKLATLVGLWALARVVFLFGATHLEFAAFFDILFMLGLLLATAHPIIKREQWLQLGILTKLACLLLGNVCFYLGALGWLPNGATWGLYGGLYLIISLILVIGSRVLPSFIRSGVDYQVEIKNSKPLAMASLVIFVLFFINQLFLHNPVYLTATAGGLFLVTSLRLYDWHTPDIWRKPLLWSLYIAFCSIDLGFLLFALSPYLPISQFIALHAMAFGGIGLATLGMMARVTLGHTGRNIRSPPKYTATIFLLLLLGLIFRIFLPLLLPAYYENWMLLAQVFWILGFVVFLVVNARFLVSK